MLLNRIFLLFICAFLSDLYTLRKTMAYHINTIVYIDFSFLCIYMTTIEECDRGGFYSRRTVLAIHINTLFVFFFLKEQCCSNSSFQFIVSSFPFFVLHISMLVLIHTHTHTSFVSIFWLLAIALFFLVRC